jgi:hypothetical protein
MAYFALFVRSFETIQKWMQIAKDLQFWFANPNAGETKS